MEQKNIPVTSLTDLQLATALRQTVSEFDYIKKKLDIINTELNRRNDLDLLKEKPSENG